MSLPTLINRPVIILHRAATEEVDQAGDAVESELAVETVGELQPLRTDERPSHPDIAESDWVGYFLPADVAFLTSASAVWAPELGEYEVVGSPAMWRHPRHARDSYVEANLKRVAGPEDDLDS